MKIVHNNTLYRHVLIYFHNSLSSIKRKVSRITCSVIYIFTLDRTSSFTWRHRIDRRLFFYFIFFRKIFHRRWSTKGRTFSGETRRDATRHDTFSRSLDSLRVSVTRVHKSSLPWQRSIARAHGNGVFAPSVKPILGIKIYDNQGCRGENLIRPR